MAEDNENEDVEKVVDPNENQGNKKVSLDSTESDTNLVDPNENQRTGSE